MLKETSLMVDQNIFNIMAFKLLYNLRPFWPKAAKRQMLAQDRIHKKPIITSMRTFFAQCNVCTVVQPVYLSSYRVTNLKVPNLIGLSLCRRSQVFCFAGSFLAWLLFTLLSRDSIHPSQLQSKTSCKSNSFIPTIYLDKMKNKVINRAKLAVDNVDLSQA